MYEQFHVILSKRNIFVLEYSNAPILPICYAVTLIIYAFLNLTESPFTNIYFIIHYYAILQLLYSVFFTSYGFNVM